MNAMAQIGAAQRAPEIVIVNDGKPVESVSARARGITIPKYAAIAIVPFLYTVSVSLMNQTEATSGVWLPKVVE